MWQERSDALDSEVGARERGGPGRGADTRAHVKGVVAGAGEEVFGRPVWWSSITSGGGEGEALWEDGLVAGDVASGDPGAVHGAEVRNVAVIVGPRDKGDDHGVGGGCGADGVSGGALQGVKHCCDAGR